MTTALPFGDNPIDDASEDQLGRTKLAHVLASELASIDVTRGAVAAITGQWGSGKTSLMNLAATELRKVDGVTVVEFNPWLFSGAEELAATFLSELAAQLRDSESAGTRARKVGANVADAISRYSGALSALRFVPGVGAIQEAVEATAQLASKSLHADTSLHAQRAAALQALHQLNGRIVVLVDDIDRLNRSEIRDLFRTVRLTASFPNIVYLLCLDRDVVEKALNEEGFSGRAYLEKILTITCAVPPPDPNAFRQTFLRALQLQVDRQEVGPFDQDLFWQLQSKVLDPLLTTMRDAKRLLASLPITLRLIGDEVAVTDVIGLEALRTLAPELHSLLSECSGGLTTTQGYGVLAGESPELSSQVERFVAADSRGGLIARAVIEVLFPAGLRHLGGQSWAPGSEALWRDQRRVASARVLAFYLTHQLPPGTARASDVAAVQKSLGNVAEARAMLAAISDTELEDLLERILPYCERAAPRVVPGAVEVLLEQFPRLRTDSRGMYDFGSEFAVTRPVLRLLRQIPGDEIYALATRLIETTPTLFAAFELSTLVGHRENAGQKLVTAEQAGQVEAQVADRMRRTPPDELAQERQLVRMLLHVLQPGEDAIEPVLAALTDPNLISAVLRDGIAVTRSFTTGSTVKESHSLRWDVLVRILGGEASLLTAADSVRASCRTDGSDERLLLALELVEKYRAGWRPRAFGED